MEASWQGIKVTVLGAGRSGRSAAKLLLRRGARVFVSDQGRPGAEAMAWLKESKCDYETGGHTLRALDAELMVVSPGVRLDNPIIVQAREKGMEVIGEIELAYRAARARIVAVTGTNGKSTTTSMIGAILSQDGQRCLVGGNLAPGRPLCELALEAGPDDIIAAEVSSFQLETIKTFRPKVAVITNITEDHLDRHPDLAAYARAKARIFENQQADDFAVINADDENTAKYCHPRAMIWEFGSQNPPRQGAWCDGHKLYLIEEGRTVPVMEVDRLGVPGRHNRENALAAVCACRALGSAVESMAKALSGFTGIPHRLEKVAVVGGVTYINNSMCTNPAAGASSLDAVTGPVIVIAGGREKGLDMAPYLRAIVRQAEAAVLIGESREAMESGLRALGYEKVFSAADLFSAVRIAAEMAGPGFSVLFSPGCSSFDMFRDFEARGQAFKQAVRELEKQ